jgi:integrating conjugative element protein (TIGR03765 family)
MKPCIKFCRLAFLVTTLFLTVSPSDAALTVVGDLGGESAAPFFDAINAQPGEFTPPESLSPPSAPTSISVASALPVRTPELTPGRVNARSLKLPGMQPVFIVGDDDLSRQWLIQRAGDLQRLNAMGFVVNVENVQGLQRLKALLPNVAMAPASGSDLARRLQLTHYPLLLTDSGIVQ